VCTEHLDRGPERSCDGRLTTWLGGLPALEMRAVLRLALEADSRHARMAAATLLSVPWEQARLPRELEDTQMAALPPASGYHALATEIHGHIDLHVGGSL